MLTVLLSLLLACQSPALTEAGQVAAPAEKPLVITHVTIIDVTGARSKADMAVVIEHGRIARIGKSNKLRAPKGAQEVDATGKFLIPGLWDMHTHIGDEDFDKETALPLFIANGVTGIRIMWGSPEHHLWRKEIEGGRIPGPRMIIGSNIIDGPKTFLSGVTIVGNEKEAREAVRKARRQGADFVKVYDNLSRDAYFAIVDEARRLKIPVEGHTPASVTAAEAAEAGQKSIEHLTGLYEAKNDGRKAKAFIASFKKNHTWQCPTLIMRHNYSWLNDANMANDPRLKYVKASRRNGWLNMINQSGKLPASEWAERQEGFKKEEGLVNRMQKANVGILAGSDNNNPYCIAGFSLHDEMALLVEAGLTPIEALKAATFNPAKFLNMLDQLGAVETGKIADLVLLDADPLTDIKNTRRINSVLVRGRLLDRKTLDGMLARVEAAVNK